MRSWKIAIWAAIVIVALSFLYIVRGILLPFVIAFIISALLDPTIRKLRLRGFSRQSAVILVFCSFFTLFTVAVVYITPIVSSQFFKFQDGIDYYMLKLSEQSTADNVFLNWNPVVQAQKTESGFIEKILNENHDLLERLGLPVNKNEIVNEYIEPYRTEIVRAARSLFTGFISIATSAASQFIFILLTPLIVFMILIDLDRFKTRSATWIPPSIRDSTTEILSDIGQVFLNYLKGVTVTVLLYAIVTSVVLAIFGAPYSILLAIIFAALYLIPYVGSWISGVTLFLVIGLSGNQNNMFFSFNSCWTFAAIITGIFLICSMIFDQLVYPRMIGKSVGLHPVISMFVIFSGGALFGLLGMIVAFPLAGSIKVILERLISITSAEHHNDIHIPAIPMRHRNATLL